MKFTEHALCFSCAGDELVGIVSTPEVPKPVGVLVLVGIIGGSVWMKYQENSPVGANLHLVPGLISSELGFLGFMGVLRYNLCFKYFCK